MTTEIKVMRFDWAMKFLLRNKANFDVLEGFLSELLGFDIKIDRILESESTPVHEKAKITRVDLLADTDKGKVIIEVQAEREIDYLSRVLFGASQAIVDHIKKGEAYLNVQKVYSVSILYFDLGKGSDYLYRGKTEFRGRHTNDILGLSEKEKQAYQHGIETPSDIFPEYYLVKVNQFKDRVKEKLDEWIYFLKNEAVKPEFTAKGIQNAAEKLSTIKMSESERSGYNNYLKDLSYEASMIMSNFTEGRAEGRAEGEAIGEAREKAKNHEEKQAMAKKLRLKGMSTQDIIDITGLSEAEMD
jgi:predicted transposase/invertase (TIGR01784 family)